MLLLDEVGLPVRVLKLEGAKDADEFIKKFGADAFRSLLRSSSTAFDFKMDKILAKHNISTAEGKIRAARELTALIATTYSGVERELYLNAAANKLGISVESLANDVKRARARQAREARQKESRDLQLTVRNFGDRVNPDAAKDPAAAAAEEVVLGLCLLFPEHRKLCATGELALSSTDFFTDFGRRVYEAIVAAEQSENGFSFSALGEHFSPDEMGRLVRLQQDRQHLQNNSKEVLQDAVESLRALCAARQARATGDWQSTLTARRAMLKKKKEGNEKN